MQIKFLGTADSGGIPTHNCRCQICQEYRTKGQINLATSAFIECDNGEIILLDAGVESIASQFDNKVIKAVFLTHFHPDHALGLLRLRYSEDSIVCYHPKDDKGFSDLFKHKKSICYIENTPFVAIRQNNLIFIPIPLIHSKNTTGYLIQSKRKIIAYLTDCAGLSVESMSFLKSFQIDTCYLDAGLAPNFNNGNHLNFKQATLLLDDIGAKKSYFIHASHYTLDYIKKNNITLKYDYLLPDHFDI